MCLITDQKTFLQIRKFANVNKMKVSVGVPCNLHSFQAKFKQNSI